MNFDPLRYETLPSLRHHVYGEEHNLKEKKEKFNVYNFFSLNFKIRPFRTKAYS